MTPERLAEVAAAVYAGDPAPADLTAEDVPALIEAVNALRWAEEEARRAATVPHLRRAPAKRPGRMSGPRYFNLMRAIEADPEGYADYRPTTYCGAPLSTEDLTVRDLTGWARRDPTAARERGICPACLTTAGVTL